MAALEVHDATIIRVSALIAEYPRNTAEVLVACAEITAGLTLECCGLKQRTALVQGLAREILEYARSRVNEQVIELARMN